MNSSKDVLVTKGLKSVTCLANYKEVWRLVNNLEEAITHLEFINRLNQQTNNTFQLIIEDTKRHGVIVILIELLDNTYEFIKQNISRQSLVVDPDMYFLGARRVWALVQASQIIWSWSDRSTEFCQKFHQLSGVKTLFKFINDNTFVFHLIEKKKHQNLTWNSSAKNSVRLKSQKFSGVYEDLTLVFKALCGAVHNLSGFENVFKQVWYEVDAFRSLVKLVGVVWDEGKAAGLGDIDLIVFMTLVHLAKSKNDLNGIYDRYLIKVCELVKIAGQKLAGNEDLERCFYKLKDHKADTNILVVCSEQKTRWRLTELIEVLIILIDLDEGQRDQISDNVLFSLKQILFNGNEVEKEYVLRLIWKLCFSKELLDEIHKDLDLIAFISGLALNRRQISRETHKYCQLILYCLRIDQPETDGRKITCEFSTHHIRL